MSAVWTDAVALLSAVHAVQFEAAFDAIALPSHATIIPFPFLRVRLQDDADETILLMALSRVGQKYRVERRFFSFPAEWEDEVRDIVTYHSLRAAVVPSVAYRMELLSLGLLDDLRSALERMSPTFGPIYPRIAVV